MPGITPPDPGKAISLAKSSDYDRDLGAFRRGGAVRYLVAHPTSPFSSTWEPTAVPERTVDERTYRVLRAGEPAPLNPGLVRSPAGDEGDLYALEDDGFEARAVPA